MILHLISLSLFLLPDTSYRILFKTKLPGIFPREPLCNRGLFLPGIPEPSLVTHLVHLVPEFFLGILHLVNLFRCKEL